MSTSNAYMIFFVLRFANVPRARDTIGKTTQYTRRKFISTRSQMRKKLALLLPLTHREARKFIAAMIHASRLSWLKTLLWNGTKRARSM